MDLLMSTADTQQLIGTQISSIPHANSISAENPFWEARLQKITIGIYSGSNTRLAASPALGALRMSADMANPRNVIAPVPMINDNIKYAILLIGKYNNNDASDARISIGRNRVAQ